MMQSEDISEYEWEKNVLKKSVQSNQCFSDVICEVPNLRIYKENLKISLDEVLKESLEVFSKKPIR